MLFSFDYGEIFQYELVFMFRLLLAMLLGGIIGAERERKNAEIEKQFLDYYTPEKTEQLIKDYEKAIAEQCLGCDYPEPLSVSKYDCQKCPERIFVDDKCVLRESYFKNKKGVKK